MQLQHSAKFNKMTLMKAIVALVVIVAVLIVGAVTVWFSARTAAFNGSLEIYGGWVENLSDEVSARAGDDAPDSSVSTSRAESLFAGQYGGFDGVALISATGRVVYASEINEERLSSDDLPSDGSTTVLKKINGVDYAVSLTKLNDDLYIAGYIDYSDTAAALNSLKTELIVVYCASIAVIIGVFVAYVILTGLNERGHRYEYKLVTDSEGRILKANAKFKEDFPQTFRFFDNVSRFDEDKLSAMRLAAFEEDQFIAAATKKLPNGKIKFAASSLDMPYNAQATKPRDIMREAYISLLPHGKPFLMGKIFLTDLQTIKDMFGREFAETVHDIIYDKVAHYFDYVYDLETTDIGVLVPDGKKFTEIVQDMREIVDSFNEYIKVENNVVKVNVKCGFSVCDNSMEQRNFEYAMLATEAALKRATEDKMKDFYTFHGSEIKQYDKYFVNYDIRQMLAENRFEMEYQPQYGIKENRVVGFEALFRVKKSAHMQVNIFELITYAERSGNMMLLGDFIFETSMRFAKRLEGKNVQVSVNVSPIQLMQAGFCDNFLEIFNRNELQPGSICVEITESFLVQNFDDAVKKLNVLREHGIEIHLDDFGTRYSSLLYLKKLPVSVIKIDREFVLEVHKDGIDRAIIEMVINICKTQHFSSIAEGVETKEDFEILKNMGVDIIQGYLIGRSMPSDQAVRFASEFKM